MGIFSGGSFPTSGGTVIITQDGYQTLNLTGNILTISGSNSSVDLSSYLDDTNTTNTSLTLNTSNVLTLTDSDSGTVTVDLSSLVTAAGGTAESTHIPVKNTSGATITKGTPVYITGNVGASDRLQIAPADASDPAKMPAIGLLETDLINNAEGYVVQGGYLTNITTDIIDGTSTSSNDTVYVKAAGGLTMTKPTGSTNYIQNIAKVARVGSGSSGSLIVSSILRTNDIPNLADGQIWVGSTTYPVSTDFNLQEVTDGGNTTTNAISIGHSNSPTYYIDVQNSTGGTLARFKDSDSVHTGVVIAGDVNGGWVGTDFFGNGIYYQDSIDALRIYTNNAEKMRITSTGAVGIGTTSPSAKLDVVSTATVISEFKNNNGDLQLYYDAGGGGIFNESLDGWYISPTGTATYLNSGLNVGGGVVIKDTGNVGIGTTSPSAKLHAVAPNGINTGGYDFNFIFDAQDVNGSDSAGLLVKGGANSPLSTIFAAQDYSGNTDFIVKGDGKVGIGTTSPSRNLSVQGVIGVEDSNNTEVVALVSTATGGAININDSSGNIDVRFDARPNYHSWINNGGSLGIGTSSPSGKLHVERADDGIIGIFRGTSNAQLLLSVSSGNLIYDSSNGGANHVFQTNSSERMRITSTGAVGIGTTSPSAKTHIVGSGNTSGTTALLVENSDGVDLVKVRDDGKVGVNTSSPNYTFHVNGVTQLYDAIFWQTGGVNRLDFGLTNEFADGNLIIKNNGLGNNFILQVNESDGSSVSFLNYDTSDSKLLLANQLRLTAYTGTTFDGTPTKILGVDASGNVVKTTRTYQTKASLSFDSVGEVTVTLPSTALYGVTATLESSAAEFIVIAQYLAGTSVKFKLYDHTGSAVTSVTRTVHYTYTI